MSLTRIDAPLVNVLSTITGTVLRYLHDVLDDVVSVKRFGAKLDGVTDDTLAWANAIASGRRLRMPAGKTRITSQLSYTGSLYIDGEGDGRSFIIFENCNGFVLTTDTTTTDIRPSIITNVAIHTTAQGGGLTALKLNGRSDGFGNQLIVRDCTFAGTDATKHWQVCIRMTKAVNTVIENNNFLGRRDGDNAYFAAMTHALYADDFSTDVKFIANKVYYCDIAILVSGELYQQDGVWYGTNGGEGWTVRDNHIVLVNTGFWSRNNGGNMFVLSGNHIAAKQRGIVLGSKVGSQIVNGSNHSFVTDNFLMKRSDSSAGYVAVECYASNSKVCNNEFRVEGTFAAGSENQIVIGGEYVTIIGNNFADADTTAVWLQSTANHGMLVGNIGGNNGTNIQVDAPYVTRALNSFDDEPVPQGVQMHKNAEQSFTISSGYGLVTFQDTVYNTGGFWSPPDAITIPNGVRKVRLAACVLFKDTGSVQQYTASIRKNGTNAYQGIAAQEGAGDGPAFNLTSGIVDVAPGDSFRVCVTSSLSTFAVTEYSWFQVEVIS